MDKPSSSEIMRQETVDGLEGAMERYIEDRKIADRLFAVRVKEFWIKHGPKDLFNPSPSQEIMTKYIPKPLSFPKPFILPSLLSPFSPISVDDSKNTGGGKLMKNTGGLHTCYSHCDEPQNHYRFWRGFAARNFLMQYKFVYGQKFCISSRDVGSSRSDKCLDSTWVAVHGMESVCMVTRRQDVDMTRVDPFYQRYCTNQQTMCSYAKTVISEVECLPYDGAYDKDFGQSIEKPFGVVSVVPDTKKVYEESGHQASSAAYDVGKAIRFLGEVICSGFTFTFDETIQTAISAFQHLCLKEFKAEDIWVTTLLLPMNEIQHLHLDQIKEHLAVINGGSMGGSGSGPSSLGGSDTPSPP